MSGGHRRFPIASFLQTSAYKLTYNAQRVQPKLALSLLTMQSYAYENPPPKISAGADIVWSLFGRKCKKSEDGWSLFHPKVVVFWSLLLYGVVAFSR